MARKPSLKQNTSLSALVRQFLTGLAEAESDFDRRKRLQAETIATIRSFHAGGRLTREQAHERRRDALR